MFIFHKVGASIVCIFFFTLMIWWGFFKLVLWHWPLLVMFKKNRSRRFVYHYTKALDQAACAGMFAGKCDESVSNKAGQIFKVHGWQSPWWVVFTKKLTERWEPNHVENSIEPVRPDPEGL